MGLASPLNGKTSITEKTKPDPDELIEAPPSADTLDLNQRLKLSRYTNLDMPDNVQWSYETASELERYLQVTTMKATQR